MCKYILPALLICLLPAGVFAAEGMPSMAQAAEKSFQKMDANGDQKVIKEEFMNTHPGMQEGAFTQIDANGDGCIVFDEWYTFMVGHNQSAQSSPMSGMVKNGGNGGQNSGCPVIMPPSEKK